jgi:DNA polymerase V
MPRGGKRKGAGRPRGKGPWKEATKPLRIPLSLLSAVTEFMETSGYRVPVYMSRVPAGTPEDADDYVEKKADLNSLLLRNPKDTFLLRVTGDSMMDAGIYENDMLTVDRKDREGIILVPQNRRYMPIKILPQNDFQIVGVVTNVIRKIT